MLNDQLLRRAQVLARSPYTSDEQKARLNQAISKTIADVQISTPGKTKRTKAMTTTRTPEQQAVSAQAKASQAKMTPEEATVEKMPRHNQSLYHCLTLLGRSHTEALAKVREAQSLEATQGRQMMGSLI